jgi:hypothetical protein
MHTTTLQSKVMKRFISINFVISTLLVAVHSLIAAAGTPKLSVEKMTIDLGAVTGGSIKNESIVIKNTGTDTLKIKSIRASCGCTTVKPSKNFLLPGQSDKIAFSLNTNGITGQAKKFVYIETNDPTSAITTVTLMADVQYDLMLTSHIGIINMGNFTVGKSSKSVLTFKNMSNKPITLKRISGLPKNSEITPRFEKPTVLPGESVRVELHVVPKDKGQKRYQLSLETNNKKQPSYPFTVMMNVQ